MRGSRRPELWAKRSLAAPRFVICTTAAPSQGHPEQSGCDVGSTAAARPPLPSPAPCCELGTWGPRPRRTIARAESQPHRGFLLKGLYLDESFDVGCPIRQLASNKYLCLIQGPGKWLLEILFLHPQSHQKQICHKAKASVPAHPSPPWEAATAAPATHSWPSAFVNLALVRYQDLNCLTSLPPEVTLEWPGAVFRIAQKESELETPLPWVRI